MSCPSRSRRVALASTSKAMKGATLDLRDKGILGRDRSAKSKSFVIFPVFAAASRQNTAALQGSYKFELAANNTGQRWFRAGLAALEPRTS